MKRVPAVMSTSCDHGCRLERLSTKKCRASSSPARARATSTLYTHTEAGRERERPLISDLPSPFSDQHHQRNSALCTLHLDT
jgi:hypothetical protein